MAEQTPTASVANKAADAAAAAAPAAAPETAQVTQTQEPEEKAPLPAVPAAESAEAAEAAETAETAAAETAAETSAQAAAPAATEKPEKPEKPASEADESASKSHEKPETTEESEKPVSEAGAEADDESKPAISSKAAGKQPEVIQPPPPAVLASGSGSSDPTPAANAAGPTCVITLLLPSGVRRVFRLDQKYLDKHDVRADLTADGRKDPYSVSVYKFKELILRDWRDEWNDKPASPTSIRLIHFGKLLNDKEQLKKYQFTHDAPNVVHMSVKPPEMVEDDEAGKGKAAGSVPRAREGGRSCCVIL